MFLKQNKTLLGLAVAILAIAIAAVGAFFVSSLNKDVLATIGAAKIKQKDLDNKITALEGYVTVDASKKNQLLDDLVEESIIEQTAKRLKITVSEKEIDDSAKKYNQNYSQSSSKDKIIENTRKAVLKEKVKDAILSLREGKYIKVRFDRHYPEQFGGTVEEQKKDKEYAKNLSEEIFNDLKSGKITFEQAQVKVNEDKTVDIASYPGVWTEQYGSFGKNDAAAENSIYNLPEFQENIYKLKKGEVGSPFTVSDYDGGEKREIYFLIIKVEKIKEGEANNYADWLEKEKTRLKYKKIKEIK